MKISISNICTAFDSNTIGTKVFYKETFLKLLSKAIAEHDFSRDRIPGQAYLLLPGAEPMVSSGQGQHSLDPRDYLFREYRGRVHAFLRRHRAGTVIEVAAVVYTKEAYLNDPDIFEGETTAERDRIVSEGPDYVVVAVLAASIKGATLSPYRFVKNLAGGNHEALAWSADEIRAKAREIAEQTDTWGTVADPEMVKFSCSRGEVPPMQHVRKMGRSTGRLQSKADHN